MACIDMNTWYSRVDKPDRPDLCSSTSTRRATSGFAEAVEVALLVKSLLDGLGLEASRRRAAPTGCTCSCPIDAPLDVRRHARVRRDRRAHARVDTSRPRHDRVDEGEAARRADRREPERRGEDDRLRLLGAPRAGRAGLDAAALGRGQRRRSTRAASRWTSSCERIAKARRPVLGRAQREAVLVEGAGCRPLAAEDDAGHVARVAVRLGVREQGHRAGLASRARSVGVSRRVCVSLRSLWRVRRCGARSRARTEPVRHAEHAGPVRNRGPCRSAGRWSPRTRTADC